MRRYLDTGTRRVDWHAVRTTGLHKDGHEFPIEIAFSEVFVEGTRQFGAFIRDVTQRSLAEEALKQGEARYRALAENALDLVCELDAEGRFSYASPNFRTVLGYEPADLLGKSAFEFIHPDDQARVGAEYAAAIADPASGTITFRFRHADGSWASLDVGANIYHNEAGEARGVIVARDIGARVELEAAMRESDERLRTFIESAPLIFFATDAAGVFTLYEGAGLEGIGLQPGQFVGRSVFDVHRDTPRIMENMRRALAGESFTDMVEIGPVAFEAHHTPLNDAAGTVTGMAGVLIDATARVRAEAALRESNVRLRTFMQNAPVILFATDSEGVFTLFDGKGLEPLGILAGQLVGQSLFETLAQFPDIVAGRAAGACGRDGDVPLPGPAVGA